MYVNIFLLPIFSQDYEYASFNPVAYDIANHFCEMAADYHTETPHILDYSKYPGKVLNMFILCCTYSSDFSGNFKLDFFPYGAGLEERRRFVEKYLSSSGTYSLNRIDRRISEISVILTG